MVFVHLIELIKSIGFIGQLILLVTILLGAGWLRRKINGSCPYCKSRKLRFQDGLFVGKEYWTCLDCKNGGEIKGGRYAK